MEIREAVDTALEELRAKIEGRYGYSAVDIYDGDSMKRGPVFTGTKFQAEEVQQAINTTLWDFGQKLIYMLCEHEWVDARNEIIESGNYCRKCNVIRI